MSTAYMAEIDTPAGTRYLSKKFALSRVPYFFTQAPALNRQLQGVTYDDPSKFNQKRDWLQTVVVVVKDLEKGIRASQASRHSISEFQNLKLGPKARVKWSANTVFKIEIPLSIQNTKKKFFGEGKFGRTWEEARWLRSHIGSRLSRLAGVYKGAFVVAIEMNDDGFTPAKITRLPILEFYLQSPDSAARYAEHTRGSKAFAGVSEPKGRFV